MRNSTFPKIRLLFQTSKSGIENLRENPIILYQGQVSSDRGLSQLLDAFRLVLDFDFIEEGAEKGAPKYMEWYGAFGLIITLVWLYLEILRLLAKLQSRK